jgi:hypothetical protein
MDEDVLELYNLIKKSDSSPLDFQSKCNKVINELVEIFNESVELHKNIEERKKKIKEDFDEMCRKIKKEQEEKQQKIDEEKEKQEENKEQKNQEQKERHHNDNQDQNENQNNEQNISDEIVDEPEKPTSEKLEILINKLFRFIALYCHPDKANTDEKKEISKLFVPANKAKKNKKVINLFLIYQQVIEKGFTNQIPQWTEDDLNIIKYELKIYKEEINNIKDTFLGQWDSLSQQMKDHYFENMLKVNGIKK